MHQQEEGRRYVRKGRVETFVFYSITQLLSLSIFAAGLYFESGCAKKLSKWMKGWSGGICGALIIAALLEVSF